MHKRGWSCPGGRGVWFCVTVALTTPGYAGAASESAEPAAHFCADHSITDPASDRLNAWGKNTTRVAMLHRVKQAAEETGVESLVGLEIGLAGSHSVYNSVWFLETPSGIRSLRVETPDTPGRLPVSSERTVDQTAYALLWTELEDLRAWDTPSDTRTVALQSDIPVFTATLCRAGRLHRVRIDNPPLPTWGQDDSFEQARRRHDKKAREFMLRPRDRAIEVMRLIQAF
jgi:hypothetical protein